MWFDYRTVAHAQMRVSQQEPPSWLIMSTPGLLISLRRGAVAGSGGSCVYAWWADCWCCSGPMLLGPFTNGMVIQHRGGVGGGNTHNLIIAMTTFIRWFSKHAKPMECMGRHSHWTVCCKQGKQKFKVTHWWVNFKEIPLQYSLWTLPIPFLSSIQVRWCVW